MLHYINFSQICLKQFQMFIRVTQKLRIEKKAVIKGLKIYKSGFDKVYSTAGAQYRCFGGKDLNLRKKFCN